MPGRAAIAVKAVGVRGIHCETEIERALVVAALLALGLVLPATAGTLPVAVGGQALPSLAPMLAKVSPAVVNISSTSHRRVAVNPFFSDPIMRQFFGLPAEPPSRFTVWISRFLSRFFPRLGVLALDPNGVSRDPAVVASYLADPLVYTGKIGARLGKEFMDAMAAAQAGAPKIRLPILLQHGDHDSLASVAGSHYLFDHVASTDKRLEIYPGLFHEIYNEPERDAELDELIGWFDAHVGAR